MNIALPLTSLYAAISALLLVVMAVMIARLRMDKQLFISEGESWQLRRYRRALRNFSEYVPLALLLLLLSELQGTPPLVLHGIGGILVIGRLLHIHALLIDEPQQLREQPQKDVPNVARRHMALAFTLGALVMGSVNVLMQALIS